jgi:hypothetical protein
MKLVKSWFCNKITDLFVMVTHVLVYRPGSGDRQYRPTPRVVFNIFILMIILKKII